MPCKNSRESMMKNILHLFVHFLALRAATISARKPAIYVTRIYGLPSGRSGSEKSLRTYGLYRCATIATSGKVGNTQ